VQKRLYDVLGKGKSLLWLLKYGKSIVNLLNEINIIYLRVTPPSPLRTAYRPILALRTAYRYFLASRTAYRLTTKTTILGVSIYTKKIKLQ